MTRPAAEAEEATRDGREEVAAPVVDPSLHSLVVPWSILAVAAVCSAAWVSASSSDENGGVEWPSSAEWEAGWDHPTFGDVSSPHDSDGAAGGGGGGGSVVAWMGRALRDGAEKLTFNEEHKPLRPLGGNDFVGFFCATIGLMVAAGGGIGGGGILVPIYILVMGFSPKHAIPLSNITVFGGALANTYLNTRKRHPLAERPLVDWDLILVMEPLTIAGALIGAFLNKVLPETFLVVMLVALLSFTAYNTLKKSLKMYAAESRHMREEMGIREDGTKESELTRIAHDEDEVEASDHLLDGERGEGGSDEEGAEDVSLEEDDDEMDDELRQIMEEEREAPMMNIMVLVTMFVVVLFINLMKGGGAFPSPLGIKCGSTSFWVANFLMLGWIFIISVFARAYLVRRFELKKEHNYQYVDGDIQWDSRATIVYPIVCCFAGFFAGMFGVGGGIVKGPLMLAMGVHPAVSSASSACMILFTSFTATTSFIVFGLLVPDYAIICFVIGFIATLFGQIGLFYLMAKYKRNSYIAFSIGGVVLLSAFLMTIQSLVSMAEGAHHHSGGICGKGD
uniref:Uncharacterized protein n=1 Tax=Odontella aurita TaxID=265563 RepID=A0A7S4JJ89_9STRA